MNGVKLQQASSWDIWRTKSLQQQWSKPKVSMAAWEEERAGATTKRAVVRVGAIAGSPSHVSVTTMRWFGSWMHAHTRLRPGRHGVAALSYQTLFPRSHPARSRRPTCGLLSPSPGGCVHRTGIRDGCLGDANGRPQSLTLQGQPELFSFGLWGCWPAKHMDRFGC